MNRPTWDEYFLNLAEKVAVMGTCDRKKMGAVIVNPKTKEIISTGFNGAPAGITHCTNKSTHICEGGCLNDEDRCVRSIHAEHNAILFAKQDLTGMTLYATNEPCENCTKDIIQKGIKRVVYKNLYYNKYNAYFKNLSNISWEYVE